ncbi:unnamed protein product, partial [Heterotrigona itama]
KNKKRPLVHLQFIKILVEQLRGDFRQPRDRTSTSIGNNDEIRSNGKLHAILIRTKK